LGAKRVRTSPLRQYMGRGKRVGWIYFREKGPRGARSGIKKKTIDLGGGEKTDRGGQ